MWKPPILLCSTASRPSARSSPYSGKKCATGWRAAIALLTALALTPDVLALPWQPPAWSAVQVDEQWLIRPAVGRHGAENVWLTELLQSEAEEHVIDSYSPPPAAPGVWREQPAQTLLTLAHAIRQRRNSVCCRGSSPSGGGLRRRAGVRRGMPRWLWRYWQGQTACWTIAIWRVRPRRRTGQPGLLSPLVSDGEKGD
ncbi:pullulanase secretion protein PulL [Klebsiella pneumoniae]|uniref:Pullulanase secretion protein PulL n=1 Tax=Klebsiella pneumoniae TaxID=573 RepID=A0A377UXC3_KLEPN|nr:pullulanase secretion protein PulL [Klebsiella pneumoniae]